MEKNIKHQDELLRTVMHRVAKDTERTSLSDDFADRLVQRIRKEESAKRNQMQHKRIWLSVGIAAAILLLLVMGFWLNGKFNEKPELVAKTDTTKAAPQVEEEQGARDAEPETKQKPVEKVDTVRKVKELQRIGRPPKQYMAKVEKEELSEPEIQKKTLESEVAIEYAGSTVWRADENMFQSTYEDVVREIQERGERMNKSIELAMGDDLY